jgi:phospholipase/lecithinase/hemolysin
MKKMFEAVAALLLSILPFTAQAGPDRVVVFGTSLSDPGNAFALKGGVNTPPYDDPAKIDASLIPDVPYAVGGHHFSNGATWVEQFARQRGLAGNTRPAFEGSSTEATNYAVGGARAYQDGVHFNLPDQVNRFLTVFGSAPSDALYVIEFGGNDIRDALVTGNPAVISDALTAIGNNIGLLYAKGARKFLVWNAPNLGQTPAIRALDSLYPGVAYYAGLLTDAFNANLDHFLSSLEGLPGIEIIRLDVYTKLNQMVGNPGAFGFSNAEAACIMPAVPPFECQSPDEFLFWDGIHPTKAGHAIIAQEAAFALTQH